MVPISKGRRDTRRPCAERGCCLVTPVTPLVFMGTCACVCVCVWSLCKKKMLCYHFRLIYHLELIKSKLIFIFN